tara:strand:- start:20480 stop:20821 length:342 start_codon:yes stop_codon:yes gene_type:complete
MSKVNNKTRAPTGGREIVCPECDRASTVYHFSWSALACVWCEAEVNKNDWLIGDSAMREKLWVFDTQQYLEVYAPTLEAAELEVQKFEADSGLDFVLHHEWKIYQDEHEAETN